MKKFFYDENYLLECGEKVDIDRYLLKGEIDELTSGPSLQLFSEANAEEKLVKSSKNTKISTIEKIVEFGEKEVIRSNNSKFDDKNYDKGRIFDENSGRTVTFSPNVRFETEQ